MQTILKPVSHNKTCRSIQKLAVSDNRGSVRMSLGLVFVMIVIILVFSLIDYLDRTSNNSTAPDTTRGFRETDEGAFFDDAKYQNQPQDAAPKEKSINDLTEEDVDPTLDPKYQETNAKNSYYHPLTEEQKREKEKLKQERARKLGQ